MPQSSFQFARNVLEAFLQRPTAGILAIKGKWGVGKTFLWQETVKTFPASASATFAYVSLFGVTSIASLRRMIVSRRAPFPKSPTLMKRFFTPATKATTLLRYVNINVVKNTELLAEAIEDSVLHDIVVCVDDLERKEPSLSEHALLGFLTSLRDEKNCKVVLLFNDEVAAEKEGLGPTLSEYREKVIDAEVSLQPSSAECFDLVFGVSVASEATAEKQSGMFFAADNRSIREIFADAKVANIRVLRRTQETLRFFEAELKKRYPLLWPSFACQVTKLCILNFIHGKEFNLQEVVKKDRWIQIHLNRKKDGAKEKDLERFTPVFDLNYHPRETDTIIVDFLTSGYVDFIAASVALEKAEETHRRDALRGELHRNWDFLWNNFQATGEQFVSAQTAVLRSNFDKLSLAEISQFAAVAEQIGDCSEARAMLEKKLSQFVEITRDMDDLGMILTGVTESIVERVHTLRKMMVPTKKPIGDVIDSMADHRGWTPSDVQFIAGHSQEEFYEWIVNSTDPRLITKLKTFRERIGSGDVADSVRQKFESALRRLAKRSAIDAFRIRNGVGLDPEPPVDPNM